MAEGHKRNSTLDVVDGEQLEQLKRMGGLRDWRVFILSKELEKYQRQIV